ncbi:hypothetical protein BH09VER1_BH09VER1_48810 [soil metagenome]
MNKRMLWLLYLTIYFLISELSCLLLWHLLDRSIAMSLSYYKGIPVPALVALVKEISMYSWIYPVIHLIAGLYLYGRFPSKMFFTLIFVEISMLFYVFYCVMIFIASALAWIHVPMKP